MDKEFVSKINTFVKMLASVSEDNRFIVNPYLDSVCRYNLIHYLQHLSDVGVDVMLVGEAPGYRGCAITGIPFTDEVQLKLPENFYALGSWMRPESMGNTAERSASIVWEKLREHHIVPLIWNAFPFHPYSAGNMQSNRVPTRPEIQEGIKYIKLLMEIFSIDINQVFTIGQKAALALEFVDNAHRLRHPSYDFKKLFPLQFDSKIGASKDA